MVAPTASTADTNVLLVDPALGLGYKLRRPAMGAVVPPAAGPTREIFATCRGQSPEPAFAYCRRCDVTVECLD
jgi:hypothetical protein